MNFFVTTRFFLGYLVRIAKLLNFLNFELLTVSFFMRPTIMYNLKTKQNKPYRVFHRGVGGIHQTRPPTLHGSQGIPSPWVLGLIQTTVIPWFYNTHIIFKCISSKTSIFENIFRTNLLPYFL